MLNDDVLQSIRNLAEYLHDDEEKHYSECEPAEKENHIYTNVKKVLEWFDDEDNAIIVTCTKCGKLLFEGTEEQRKGLIIYCTECNIEVIR